MLYICNLSELIVLFPFSDIILLFKVGVRHPRREGEEMEDPSSALALAMELDDNDAASILEFDKPVADADFFNSFEDDFDDSDIN
ncbi:Small acidic protein 2 [Apostasia shenzhenica]|uniref:Small acidic protein 2 n=1 Tax=Apostasia shenzhenica TaxID=1088818 RepID=A0A2I0AAV8_9ASPA|nr:Small acidic protein 2 [Apostasia shenzhenica]